MLEVLNFLGNAPSYFDDWINLLTAFGTIGAVFVALFGKVFINWWYKIDLDIVVTLEPLIRTTMNNNGSTKSIYQCILKLIDKKGKKLVKNAKVKLISYSWKENNKIKINNIHGETLLPFITNNKNKTVISFLKKQELDFGYFSEYNNSIDFNQLAAITHPHTKYQDNYIEYSIYQLEIISDNYFSDKEYYIQVYYNKGKVGKLEELVKDVNIQVVNSLEDFRVVKVIEDF
jgi:hypothetical protein